MMKRLGSVFAIVLIAVLLLPVVPVDSAGMAIGTVVVRDNGVETTYLGKTIDGDYLWEAIIESPQYLDDLVTPIDARWDYDSDKKEWFAKANLFNATVKDSKVTVWYEGKSLSWQPDVYIGTKKQAVYVAPQLIIYDPINENYAGNTLLWQYGNITRSVRLIEGMLQEYYTITEHPGEDILIISHSEKDAGFVWTRPAVAWDSDNKLVDLKVVGDDITLTLDTMKEATFPITIDPDTTFTTSSSDGHLSQGGSSSYSTIHNEATGSIYASGTTYKIGQRIPLIHYYIYRAYLFFNTSVIPSTSNITSAVLRLYGSNDYSDDNFNITIQNGQPTYPHDPLEAGDYLYSHYSGDGGSLNTTGFSTTGYNNITLNTDGISWIQRGAGATTKFCLRSSKDINSVAPTGNETIEIYSYEQGDGYLPQLVIIYAASGLPSITTNAATKVTRSTARLNSYLNTDGGEVCNVRFQYGNSTGNYTSNTSWVNDTYITGDSPYTDIASLATNTTYYFRVQATNSEGMDNGTELNFTTSLTMEAPTDFIAYPNSTSISLTWTKGVGATYTMIRGQAGAYPANYTEGKQVYNGSMSTVLDTSLTPGTTYYYRAWSFDNVGYSTNNTTILMTTTAYTEVTQDVPATATAPSSWWGMPDYTNLENIAGYGIINDIADNYEIPRNTFWMSLIIVAIMCIGLFIYSVQHNVTVALVLTSIMIVVAAIAGLLPMFMLVIIGVPIAGIMIIKRRV